MYLLKTGNEVDDGEELIDTPGIKRLVLKLIETILKITKNIQKNNNKQHTRQIIKWVWS